MNEIVKRRLVIGIIILVLIPLGFYTKYYIGPGHKWVFNSLGGLLYVLFWCLLTGLIFPKTKPFKIVALVFILTSMIEFLQLWHPPFLQEIRKSFIGKTLLGNSFNANDFIYYLLGSLIGFLILKWINRIYNKE